MLLLSVFFQPYSRKKPPPPARTNRTRSSEPSLRKLSLEYGDEEKVKNKREEIYEDLSQDSFDSILIDEQEKKWAEKNPKRPLTIIGSFKDSTEEYLAQSPVDNKKETIKEVAKKTSEAAIKPSSPIKKTEEIRDFAREDNGRKRGRTADEKPKSPLTAVRKVRILDEKAAAIRDYAKRRNIKRLIHFTRESNLRSILQHGLILRNILKQEGFCNYNDRYRHDRTNAICLSVGFPNYKFFYSLQKQYRDENWVVLSIDPSVLWKKKVVFCATNAASRVTTNLTLEERMNIAAFRRMYEDNNGIEMGLPPPSSHPHSKYYWHLSYPFDPQAEVLVLDNIPKNYIISVSVSDPRTEKRLANTYPDMEIKMDNYLFSPRYDYKKWRYKEDAPEISIRAMGDDIHPAIRVSNDWKWIEFGGIDESGEFQSIGKSLVEKSFDKESFDGLIKRESDHADGFILSQRDNPSLMFNIVRAMKYPEGEGM